MPYILFYVRMIFMNAINPCTIETGTVSEIHARLVSEGHHVSKSGLRRWIKTGILPAVNSGTRYYIRYSNVLQLLEAGVPQQQPREAVQGIRAVI